MMGVVAGNLTLTSVVFEFYFVFGITKAFIYLTLTSVVFELQFLVY